MRQSNYKRQLVGLLLLATVLFGSLSTSAQTRRSAAAQTSAPGGGKTVAANQPKQKSCEGGYSGTVTYTNTLTDNWSGKFGSHRARKKVFQVNIPIRADGGQTGSALMSPDGRVTGTFNFKARATATLSDSDLTVQNTEGERICSFNIKGVKSKSYEKCSTSTDHQSQASGEGDVTVFVRLSGDKLYLSSDVPRLNGQTVQTSKSSCSGGCAASNPLNSSRTLQITNDKQHSFYTDENRVTFNPASFNRLSGSFTRTSTDGKTVETIEWNLSRCAPPLRIENIRFEHHRVPDPTAWHGVDPLRGTIDGNLVKIKAKIYNNGGDTVYPNVKFFETTSGADLPDSAISAAIKPGEWRDVEYEWDTSGFAWDDNRKAKMKREIKVEIDGDAQTAKIKILPKPVVMVHGLWANAAGWANYPIYLRSAHSYDWEGFAVGADPEHGKMNTGDTVGNWEATNTIFQNSQELAKQIKHVRESKNAWHIDIVAHSMGGLISRHYINTFMLPVFDGKPEATHLVMLGTPNQGSPCANLVDGLFGMFGNQEMQAIKELRPATVAKFNSINTNRKGVKFSILAGYTVRATCQDWGLGDGVVPLPSALYNISDRDYSRNIHTELTGKDDFEKFVLPRLAVGPKKARAEQTTAWLENLRDEKFTLAGKIDGNARDNFNQYIHNASFRRENAGQIADDADAASENLTTRQKIDLKGKETREIEIPVRDGKHAGVLIVASYAVSATLLDETGAIVGKNIVDNPDAPRELFRTINFDRAIRNGVWRLKLENFDANEAIVYVAGWTTSGAASSFTVEAGKPTAAGGVRLEARLIENNTPVTGAKITGVIVGQTTKVEFFDDGKHADGAAGDGVYGGSAGKLPPGEYFVEAIAEVNNQTSNHVAPITVGATVSPKTATRKGK